MPEALAIVAVVVIAIFVYLSLWAQSRNPALHHAATELARLRRHAEWLEERRALAQRENWDADMVARIEAGWRATGQELARRAADESTPN